MLICIKLKVFHKVCFSGLIVLIGPGNWLKRSSLSGLTDGVEDLLDISSVDRLSFIRQSSKVSLPEEPLAIAGSARRNMFHVSGEVHERGEAV